MNLAHASSVAFLLLAGAGFAQVQQHSIILPADAVRSQIPSCSRSVPRIDGTWLPSPADAAALERDLPALAALSPKESGWSHSDPAHSFLQLLGVVIGKHRLLHINAVPGSSHFRDPKQIVVVCDGGPAFWEPCTTQQPASFPSSPPTGRSDAISS